MTKRCVVAGCGNIVDKAKDISAHAIPYSEDERPEAKKRRKKWVDFVNLKRAKWTPTQYSVICSEHFKPEDYSRRFTHVEGEDESSAGNRRLKRDEIGICVFPTIMPSAGAQEELTHRDKRKIIKEALLSDEKPTGEPTSSKKLRLETEPTTSKEVELITEPTTSKEIELSSIPSTSREVGHSIEETPDDGPGPVDESVSQACVHCAKLLNDKRKLSNRVKTLREIVTRRQKEVKAYQKKVKVLESRITKLQTPAKSPEKIEEAVETVVSDSEEHDDGENYEMESELDEPDDQSGSQYETETEAETTETEDSIDLGRLPLADTNLRTEPKYVVFLSHLLLLFKFCQLCKHDNPEIELRECGTSISVRSKCPSCDQEMDWHSQPYMPGSQIKAGNFLLSLSIPLSGGSPARVSKLFSHMGLGCVSLKSYYKYQREKIFPTIHIYWEVYQKKALEKVRNDSSNGVVVAGDGRHDSMGHSAKYCAYTIFCCNVPMIIHFDIVQRNEAGSSPAMEFLVFKRCMDDILSWDLLVTTFVSDRHKTIASHMRKVLKHITHYFDIWHLKKKIRKVLSKIAKEKGFEDLAEWIKPCLNHLHWSAMSTYDGNGLVIWAKFKAFLNHVVNEHSELEDPLFTECAHGDIGPKKWLQKGTALHDCLVAELTKKALVSGIKKASPLAQTSCLEGFHSVLNHFSPKMLAYSYTGMYCRHILAAVHFNYNLQRDTQLHKKTNQKRITVSYPKFKNGEAVVRDVRIKPNFEYVEEIFQTFLHASKNDLKKAAKTLKEKTPAAMDTMLNKQSKPDAIKKRDDRGKMVVKNVPPTTPVSEVVATSQASRKPKSAPKCRMCKQPMKGHKFVKDCPKNANSGAN